MNPEIYNLSDNEKDAGFQKYLVRDPEANIGEADDRRVVVGHILSSSDMLWKDSLFGAITYKLKRFGVYKDRSDTYPRWFPVGNRVFDDPGVAIQEASYGEPQGWIRCYHPD
jgi:hypothetical protein